MILQSPSIDLAKPSSLQTTKRTDQRILQILFQSCLGLLLYGKQELGLKRKLFTTSIAGGFYKAGAFCPCLVLHYRLTNFRQAGLSFCAQNRTVFRYSDGQSQQKYPQRLALGIFLHFRHKKAPLKVFSNSWGAFRRTIYRQRAAHDGSHQTSVKNRGLFLLSVYDVVQINDELPLALVHAGHELQPLAVRAGV